ncbi:unnamed protein product [Scytosiphon promiscuus]
MEDDSKVLDIIVEELTEAKAKHAVPRRTMIKPDEGEQPKKKEEEEKIIKSTAPCHA